MNSTDPKIFVIRVAQFDLTKIVFADVIKGGTLINDVLMRDDDQMVICGMNLVIDLAGVTANHLFQFDFEFLKQVAILYQDASPLRMKGIHIMNPPPGMRTVVNMFNSLLSAKNKSKRVNPFMNQLVLAILIIPYFTYRYLYMAIAWILYITTFLRMFCLKNTVEHWVRYKHS